MANRLHCVPIKMIKTNAKKGRNLAPFLRAADGFISYLKNKKKMPGILLVIDFTRAFNTISTELILHLRFLICT